jgi:hypothetical protein
MDEYVSPVDGHRHFGDAGRAECAVCRLEAERDRLREEVTTMSIQSMGVETEYHDACAERDRLRAAVEASDGPVAKTMEYLGRVEAERDRLRVVVDLVKEYRVQHGRFWLLENNENEAVAAAERESYAWSEVVSALDALDESAEATDG